MNVQRNSITTKCGTLKIKVAGSGIALKATHYLCLFCEDYKCHRTEIIYINSFEHAHASKVGNLHFTHHEYDADELM